MLAKHVKVNERGRRIGESHPRAKLTDHEVDLICELYESLRADGMSMAEASGAAAGKFEISPRTVTKYVYGERRGQAIARVKRTP